jgi:hypothetical protein
MRRYEVGIGSGGPVTVEAEEAVWDDTLKFMAGGRKIAVFFNAVYFKEIPACDCREVEVDAGGCVGFTQDTSKCAIHGSQNRPTTQ